MVQPPAAATIGRVTLQIRAAAGLPETGRETVVWGGIGSDDERCEG